MATASILLPTGNDENEHENQCMLLSTTVDEAKLAVAMTTMMAENSGWAKMNFLHDDDVFQISSENLPVEETKTDNYRIKVTDWKGDLFYSDYIKLGLEYNKQRNYGPSSSMIDTENVVMVFECPATCNVGTSFQNKDMYCFHDWPPSLTAKYVKGVLGPNRYSSVSGSAIPIHLKDGIPPKGLMEHWEKFIPKFVKPNFVNQIDTERDVVYSYLPLEQAKYHVNDPKVHYHIAGKDAIPLMTHMTTPLLPDTRTKRPCVAKTTHSMASRGIFVIHNDEDERNFYQHLEESGNPTYIVTEYVNVIRNVGCHFFIHPNGNVVWFGSNENHRGDDGEFSSDSYLRMNEQDELKSIQLPFVEEVVRYCQSVGFWGFCGIDVLFDEYGQGYLVDINPRVTGSGPALMTFRQLNDKYGFTNGLFRRSGNNFYNGSANQLLDEVEKYNGMNDGSSRIILHSFWEQVDSDGIKTGKTELNISVYGNDMDQCEKVLNTLCS